MKIGAASPDAKSHQNRQLHASLYPYILNAPVSLTPSSHHIAHTLCKLFNHNIHLTNRLYDIHWHSLNPVLPNADQRLWYWDEWTTSRYPKPFNHPKDRMDAMEYTPSACMSAVQPHCRPSTTSDTKELLSRPLVTRLGHALSLSTFTHPGYSHWSSPTNRNVQQANGIIIIFTFHSRSGTILKLCSIIITGPKHRSSSNQQPTTTSFMPIMVKNKY